MFRVLRKLKTAVAVESVCVIAFTSLFSPYTAATEEYPAETAGYEASAPEEVFPDAAVYDIMAPDETAPAEYHEDDVIEENEADEESPSGMEDPGPGAGDEDGFSDLIEEIPGDDRDTGLWISNEDQTMTEEDVPSVFGLLSLSSPLPVNASACISVSADAPENLTVPEDAAIVRILPFMIETEGDGIDPASLQFYAGFAENSERLLYRRETDGTYTSVRFEEGTDESGEFMLVPSPETDTEYVLLETGGMPETETTQTEETRPVPETGGPAETETVTETALAGAGSQKETEREEQSGTEAETEPESEPATEESSSPEETEVPEEAVTEAQTEESPAYAEGDLSVHGDGYGVVVTVTAEAEIPEGSCVRAEEILPGTPLYDECLARAKEVSGISENTEVPEEHARFFDISIVDGTDNAAEIEPATPVVVRIVLGDPIPEATGENLNVLHFADGEGNPDVLETLEIQEGSDENGSFRTSGVSEVTFGSESFSVFGIFDTTLRKTVITADGHAYGVTVTYDETAEIPEGAGLDVSEITDESDSYEEYRKQAEETLGYDPWDTAPYVRLFDIKIVHEGKEVQPAQGSLVSVDIRLDDGDPNETTKIVHFADEPEIIEPDARGNTLSFETGSFSVYAIIDDPVVIEHEGGWERITSMKEFAEYAGEGMYVGNPGGYFFTDKITQITDIRSGITKTVKTTDPNLAKARGAVPYYFEQAEGEPGVYTAYCLGSGGERKYVKQNGNSLLLVDEANATRFTVTVFPNDSACYRIRGNNNYCWNMQGGTNGACFAAYNNLTDVNAKIAAWHYVPMEDDPLSLDGLEYSLAYLNGDVSAYGMLSNVFTSGGKSCIGAKTATIRPDFVSQSGILTASGENSDFADWYFTNIGENRYYMTTMINGVPRYLSVTDSGVGLLTVPHPEGSVITVVPGSGAYSGKYQLRANGKVLNFSGTERGGFNTQSSGGAGSWLNLVRKNESLNDDDFVNYTAHKVNLSDVETVPDGKQVVLYTSIWNPDELRYEYYIVDYNGALIRCYESGNSISWVGSQFNTALWDFTEYHNEDGTPNYYYELQNVYSGQYIAPQFGNGQILSDEKLGINLNGRRYGNDYSAVIAWDDAYYSYAGLVAEDGMLAAGPLSETQEFYFAVMDEAPPEQLTTVATLDNPTYGISMKMVDYNNTHISERDALQVGILGLNTNAAGLLQSSFTGDYPDTNSDKTGKPTASLSTLFGDLNMTDVNNLFIRSIYEENGYFEYDSTQNFAHLMEDGNFKVYNQIGTFRGSTGNTRVHGQFMPYNDIVEGSFSGAVNLTDVLGNTLSDLNPRKREPLYNIADPDYFFGMEMEASFTQTESGLDAWGHDAIFEFSGDDDFWLYVDGQLVLDIGGVHAASVGKINFRTGDVETILKDNKGDVIASRTGHTTLYAMFEKAYREAHPEASDTEVEEYLDGVFDMNADGQYVFTNYSTHTMKVFYMERGAGASNLHMRFNLSSVKPGTVILSKQVTGTDKADFLKAEFPYQIRYRTFSEPDTDHLLTRLSGDDYSVKYVSRNVPVKYADTYSPAGTDRVYENVFFLRPGENAEILLPPDATEYRITECCVNDNIYDRVLVNDEEIEGEQAGAGRRDYSTSSASVEDRQRVAYVNNVKDSALRTLTFRKSLFDCAGNPLSADDDSQTFSFRLYLGDEGETDVSPAYMQEYHVKNEHGEYCRWNGASGTFESTGIDGYEQLTPALLEEITYVTSPTGAISRIPAGYTVEVRNLLVGTRFMVEERENEIPEGYVLTGYDRVDASYSIEDGTAYNRGIIRDNSDPSIEVKNRQRWSLSGRKVWSDRSFTTSHGSIYFGVCVNGELLPDTAVPLENGKTSVSWDFDELLPGTSFDDYEVRELYSDGSVFTPLESGETLQVPATPLGDDTPRPFGYAVSYEKGAPHGGSGNVRTDTVTNTRDGIRIVKTDMEGNPVRGAAFTLRDEDGRDVAESGYTSGADGFVTTAYLSDGAYLLAETLAPTGYTGLTSPVEIEVSDGDVTVSCAGTEDDMYALTRSGNMYTLQIRNKPYTLELKKEDEEGGPLGEARFAIYRQVMTNQGVYRKDYIPVRGYEDLVSDAGTGIAAPDIAGLPPGTYYITETQVPRGYRKPERDILFTIGDLGTITVDENSECVLESTNVPGAVRYVYTLRAVNRKVPNFIPPTGTPFTGTLTWIILACAVLLLVSGTYRRKRVR